MKFFVNEGMLTYNDIAHIKPDNEFSKNTGAYKIEGDIDHPESISVTCPFCNGSAVVDRTRGSHTVFFTRYCPQCGGEVCRNHRESNVIQYTKRQIVDNIKKYVPEIGVTVLSPVKIPLSISDEEKNKIKSGISCFLERYRNHLLSERLLEEIKAFLSGFVRGVYECFTGGICIKPYDSEYFKVTVYQTDDSSINIDFPDWFSEAVDL